MTQSSKLTLNPAKIKLQAFKLRVISSTHQNKKEHKPLVDRSLVGRCGLYCGACGIYRAHKDNGEFLQKLAKELKCPPEKVRCEGCMALTPDCWGHDCKIVQCLRNKGLEFCYQCGQYGNNSCEKFGKLAQRYLKVGVDVRANLERIRKGETEEWLRESEEKHRCPSCGKPLPVYGIEEKCYHCGANLSQTYPRSKG